jgi:regulator of sirC expression with transglutaminase-like and TPR domain
MDPTRRFAEIVSGPADTLPLDEAVLLVAAHDHEVDIAAQRARLDMLADGCPADVAGVLARLFQDEGFSGAAADYHHPDHSFLDRVLDTRRGLPILLSIVLTEVAARAGVCLAPVALPGHFLVGDCADAGTFIDPFHGGRLLGRDECVAIFRALHPGAAFRDEFLEPVDHRVVLLRVLTNLLATYTARGPFTSVAWVTKLRSLVTGADTKHEVAKLN